MEPEEYRVEDPAVQTPARAMPHSLEAEQSVIGAILADNGNIDQVASLITGKDFYDQQLGMLFDAIVSLYDERRAIDAVTLQERLREMNAPPRITDLAYIVSLIDGAPVIGNAGEYAQIVLDRSRLRNLIRVTREISDKCYTGGDTKAILEEAEQEIFRVTQQKNAGEYVPFRKTIAEALEQINAASRTKGAVTGVATHYRDLDYYTSGFQPSDLILIAARPSVGKTAFALNIVQNMILKGHQAVAFFSLEMPRIQLANRLLAMHAHVNSHNIRTGELSYSEWESLLDSAAEYGPTKLIIDDTSGISVNEMRSRCRRYKAEHNISAIFIDYLQLMSGSSRRAAESRQNEIAEISRSLKGIARELNVPVVALSQLSRKVEERTDKTPVLSDLRESGAIEQDADVVMFIHREDRYKKDSERKNEADIIIAKHRNGPLGTITLVWLPEYTRFETMER